MRVRTFGPGLLAVIGTITPIVIVVNFVTSINAHLAANGEAAANPGFGAVLFFVIFGVLVTIFLAFLLTVLFERVPALIWGGILAGLYGSAMFFLVPGQLSELLSPCCGNPSPSPLVDWFWFMAETIPLALGLVGGVLGVFSKDQMVGRNTRVPWFVPRLVLVAGFLSLIGPVSLFGDSFFAGWSFFGLVEVTGPLLVVVCGIALYVGKGGTELLGGLVIAGSAVSLAVSLMGLILAWYLYYLLCSISVFGALFGLIAGLLVLRRKNPTP